MKKEFKHSAIFLGILAAVWGGASLAEDIDLYVAGSPTQNAPNVLLVLDNSSNWSAAGWRYRTQGGTPGAWDTCGTDTKCKEYVNQIFCGSATGISAAQASCANDTLKQGQVEAAVIRLVLNELVCQATSPLGVNVGLEAFNADNVGAYNGSSTVGGYIRRAVTTLTKGGTSCTNFIGDMDLIYGDITTPSFKAPTSASYGELFFEAFKYFGGYTDPTRAANDSPTTADDGKGTPVGRGNFGPQRFTNQVTYSDDNAFVTSATDGTYKSPISSANSCGKNYIIFIGNNYPKADDKTLLQGLNNYNYKPIWDPTASDSQIRNGDRWSKFLSSTDVSGEVSGQQPVFSYAVNVYAPGTTVNSTFTNQQKLLQSIATNGGTGASGYYEVNGNMKTLVEGLKDIFLSITAKNSVFASASLPVSVNTQGTYLNQVFIGMFRPDSDAYQRWNGNLKQYKFALDTNGNLFLADSKGVAAIDVASTGFVKQCAASFWTQDTSNWPVSGTAYWERVPANQTPESGCKTPPSDGTSTTFSLYSDWPDGSTVEKGGAAEWLRKRVCGTGNTTAKPTYCPDRIIKTCSAIGCGSVVDFVSGSGGVSTSSLSANLLNWVAGGNLGDGPPSATGSLYQYYNGTTQAAPVDGLSAGAYARPTVHGDVVHSRPLAINYGTGTSNDIVVYYGAGDGMLHAIDGNQTTSPGGTTPGQEVWAFVAPEFFSKFSRLKENDTKIAYPTVTGTPTPTPRDWFFDGTIGAYQERDTSGANSKIWIYPSMRRGGRMLYAFDATSRPDGSTGKAPTLKWRFGCSDTAYPCTGTGQTDVDYIGQTWSAPRAIRLKGKSSVYVVFGAGYDTCEDVDNQVSGTGRCSAGSATKGQGVYILTDAGTTITSLFMNFATATFQESGQYVAGRVIADVVPVDANDDGYIDLLYAVDTRGNVWRINVSDSSYNGLDPADWVLNRVAKVSDFSTLSSARKIMYAPDVVLLNTSSEKYTMILVGTGDREHPLGTSSAATVRNRFYGILDRYMTTTSVTTINGNDCDLPNDNTLSTGCDLVDVTDTSSSRDYSTALASAKGWVFRLNETCASGTCTVSSTTEQVVTTPVTAGGVTYFSTFQPTDPNASTAQCSNLGTARGYQINFLSGAPASGNSRNSIFVGGGLPPSPVSGVVQLEDGRLVPFILGGGSTGSPLEAGKVPVSIKATRKQTYRYQKLDVK